MRFLSCLLLLLTPSLASTIECPTAISPIPLSSVEDRAYIRSTYMESEHGTGVSTWREGKSVRESDEILMDIAAHKSVRPEIFAAIPAEDLFALYLYKRGGTFLNLNRALRGVKEVAFLLQKRKHEIACTISALAQLPNHAGTAYRFLTLDRRQLRTYRPGSIVREPAFTSTTIDLASFGASPVLTGNTVFEIESRTGKDVSFSESGGLSWEREVLFPPGTAFEVVRIEKKKLLHRGTGKTEKVRYVTLRQP